MTLANATTSDSSHVGDLSDEQFIELVPVMVSVGIVYGMIFMLGVVGNLMVLIAVIGNKQMHSVANMLISNLAIADLIMAATCVPVTPVMTFMKKWLLGEVLCHIIPMTSAVSVYVNTLTGIIIAIDRYIVIVHPLSPKKLSIRSTIVLICAVWVFGVLFSLPLGIVQRLQVISDTGDAFCNEIWPVFLISPEVGSGTDNATANATADVTATATDHTSPSVLKTSFDISSFCLQWVIPSLLITFCYASVSLKLTQRLRDRARFSTQKDAKRAVQEVRRNRRMNRMLTLVIASHALSWIPINLFNLMDNPLRLGTVFGKYYMFVFILTHLIAMSSVIYNPILYAWFNDKFRQEFAKMCFCLTRLCSEQDDVKISIKNGSSTKNVAKEREKNGVEKTERWDNRCTQSTVPLIAVSQSEVPTSTYTPLMVAAEPKA